MKKLALFLLALASLSAARAQFSYTFTAVGGTYTANASPTVIHASGVDDALSGALPIGFNFVMGV